MNDAISQVPWGDLWRTVVTTLAFYTVFIACAVALVGVFGIGIPALLFRGFEFVAILLSPVLACIVVWSDSIPWIGDS